MSFLFVVLSVILDLPHTDSYASVSLEYDMPIAEGLCHFHTIMFCYTVLALSDIKKNTKWLFFFAENPV